MNHSLVTVAPLKNFVMKIIRTLIRLVQLFGKSGLKVRLRMTNFEKIKKMGIRQLAEYLANLVDCDDCCIICSNKTCEHAWEQWLESEAEE
nr:MAG TPA: zona-pellucida-binding protein-like protein [Caudoviricetes sp.]